MLEKKWKPTSLTNLAPEHPMASMKVNYYPRFTHNLPYFIQSPTRLWTLSFIYSFSHRCNYLKNPSFLHTVQAILTPHFYHVCITHFLLPRIFVLRFCKSFGSHHQLFHLFVQLCMRVELYAYACASFNDTCPYLFLYVTWFFISHTSLWLGSNYGIQIHILRVHIIRYVCMHLRAHTGKLTYNLA